MSAITPDQQNVVLDKILVERRSHRQFQQEFPPEEDIRGIIRAGLHAPFAAAAVGETENYFRKFFVLKKGSESLRAAASLIFEEAMATASNLDSAMENDPSFRKQASGFAKRLTMIKKIGQVPGVGTAPYFIVVAERKGFPPVEQHALAHSLENMWLKATALGFGFQLVSITVQMADNPAFCALLGIPPGEWALMGCAIGYPVKALPPSIRPPVEKVIRWLE